MQDPAAKTFAAELEALVAKHGEKLTDNQVITVLEAQLSRAWEDACEPQPAGLWAAAPAVLAAGQFSLHARSALDAFEADIGEALPDNHELGRIDDSRGSPSFRIRVGHIRMLAAAIAKAVS